MSTKKEKCLIYARQSSGKEKESESIVMQLKNCRLLAAQKKLQIIGEYHDHNSSGRLYPTGAEELEAHDMIFQDWYADQTSDKRYRAGLGAMLEKLHKVRYIIVDDLTRLARPLSGSYLNDYLKQRFQQSGVLILTVKNGEVDYGNYMDCLVSDVQTHIVDNQLKIQTQKSRAALMELKKNGYYPTSPKMFGIEYTGGKNRNVRVNSACAEVIRFINEAIRARRPFNDIIREINVRYRHLFRTVCYPSTFRHIAEQPFYAGYMYDPEGELIEARQMKGKAILTYEEWREAQEIIDEHRQQKERKARHEHPFSGLLYCGHCGSRLVAGNDHGKIYYYCRTGTQILGDELCRQSRLNVTLVRKSRRYQGLGDAVLPLILLNRVMTWRQLRQDRLTDEEYRYYLRKSILQIKSYYDRVEITTVYGTFLLYRTLSLGNRNFPRYRLRVSGDERQKEQECHYRLTYYCPGEEHSTRQILTSARLQVYERAIGQ